MAAHRLHAFRQRARDFSGQAILPFFRTAIATEDKSRGGSFDPVTEADRAAEAPSASHRARFPTMA